MTVTFPNGHQIGDAGYGWDPAGNGKFASGDPLYVAPADFLTYPPPTCPNPTQWPAQPSVPSGPLQPQPVAVDSMVRMAFEGYSFLRLQAYLVPAWTFPYLYDPLYIKPDDAGDGGATRGFGEKQQQAPWVDVRIHDGAAWLGSPIIWREPVGANTWHGVEGDPQPWWPWQSAWIVGIRIGGLFYSGTGFPFLPNGGKIYFDLAGEPLAVFDS